MQNISPSSSKSDVILLDLGRDFPFLGLFLALLLPSIDLECRPRSLDTDHVCIGSDRVNFTNKAKNLGVILDSCLSMDSHVNQISKVSYLKIRRLGHLRSYLDINEASALASAFILSGLDYCNSLLAGLPNDKLQKLQRIQNSAARLVLGRLKYVHATPMLRELHWLPIKARIEYKLALTCFKSKSAIIHLTYQIFLSPTHPHDH